MSQRGFRQMRENNAINKAKQMSCILGGHTWKKKILSNKCGKNTEEIFKYGEYVFTNGVN